MPNRDLDNILVEYEQQRRIAEVDLEKRKKELYNKQPRLLEIEDEINKISINKTKSILLNEMTNDAEAKFNNDLNKLKDEQVRLLKKENLTLDFLKPKYKCTKCNDTGFIKFENQKTQMCTCLKQKLIDISYNKSNLSNLQKENFDNFNENIYSAEINEKK